MKYNVTRFKMQNAFTMISFDDIVTRPTKWTTTLETNITSLSIPENILLRTT